MPLELKYGSFSVLALVFSVLGFQFLLQLVELVVCDDVGLIKHLLNGHDLTLKEAIITIVSKKKLGVIYIGGIALIHGDSTSCYFTSGM